MKNIKTLVIVAVIAVIGTVQVGLAYPQAYDSMYEGAMITDSQQSHVYLLKDGFKHHVEATDNNVLWWKIYNSNGNRYVVFSQPDIDKIPEGKSASVVIDGQVAYTPAMTPTPTAIVPATTTVKVSTYPSVTTTEVISNPNSWTPLRGESCWSSSSNFGECSGRVANSAGKVVGNAAKGFFKGLFGMS